MSLSLECAESGADECAADRTLKPAECGGPPVIDRDIMEGLPRSEGVIVHEHRRAGASQCPMHERNFREMRNVHHSTVLLAHRRGIRPGRPPRRRSTVAG